MSATLRKAMILLGIVVATSVMQMLIAPPTEYVFLHQFCWVGAFLWINHCRPARAFWSGWLFGTGANVAIFNWFALLYPRRPMVVNLLMLLGYALISGLYMGVFAAGWKRVQRHFGRWWPVGIAVWFTGCEFLNPQLFPYYQGCAWYRQTWIFPVVGLAGVSFMTFLVMLCNCVLMLVAAALLQLEVPSRGVWVRNAGLLAACLAVACGWSAWQVHRLDREIAKVAGTQIALVQPTAPKLRYAEGSVQTLIRMTRAAVAAYPSIQAAIWPESALWNEDKDSEVHFGTDLARELGIEIWTGAHLDVQRADGRLERYNCALQIDATGQPRACYDKCVLAPFGESLPLSEYIPGIDKLRGKPPLTRGHGPVICDTPAGHMAFLICYEAVRYSFVRSVMQRKPDLLVVVSCDSWAKWSACMAQHFMMAAVNAAQYGVPLVRCASGGVCGTVDAVGRVQDEVNTGESCVLICTVQPCRAIAPLVQLGNWFAHGCTAVWLLIVAGALIPQSVFLVLVRCRIRIFQLMSKWVRRVVPGESLRGAGDEFVMPLISSRRIP